MAYCSILAGQNKLCRVFFCCLSALHKKTAGYNKEKLANFAVIR